MGKSLVNFSALPRFTRQTGNQLIQVATKVQFAAIVHREHPVIIVSNKYRKLLFLANDNHDIAGSFLDAHLSPTPTAFERQYTQQQQAA